MDFSLRIITDGQKATISITGLGEANLHKEEIKETLYKAIGLALGIEEPTSSCFVEQPKALADSYLPPMEKVKPTLIKEKIGDYEDREGIIENIDAIEIQGGMGHKTLLANEKPTLNENISNDTQPKNIEEKLEKNEYTYVKSMKECDIILSLFVSASEQKDKELIAELKKQINVLHSK